MGSDMTDNRNDADDIIVETVSLNEMPAMVRRSKWGIQVKGFTYSELDLDKPTNGQFADLEERVRTDEVESRKFIKLGLEVLRAKDFELSPEEIDIIFGLALGTWENWENLESEAVPSDLEIDSIATKLRVALPAVVVFTEDNEESGAGPAGECEAPELHEVKIPSQPVTSYLNDLRLSSEEFKDLRENLGISRELMGVVAGAGEAAIRDWESLADSRVGSNPTLATSIVLRAFNGEMPSILQRVRRVAGDFPMRVRDEDMAEFQSRVTELEEQANLMREEQLELVRVVRSKLSKQDEVAKKIEKLAKDTASQFPKVLEKLSKPD